MKLRVPFVGSPQKWRGRGWCGPLALASILRYYRDKSPIRKIVEDSGTLRKGGTCPRGLAFFCLSRGFKVDYINKYDRVKLNRKEYSKRFRKFLRDVKEVKNDMKFKKKCEKFAGYRFIKKRPTSRQIEEYIEKGKPVLLYLNIGIVLGNDRLSPHYIAVVGFDRKNFYVHNVYPINKSYQKIDKIIFRKAWRSDGIDQTLIVPFK